MASGKEPANREELDVHMMQRYRDDVERFRLYGSSFVQARATAAELMDDEDKSDKDMY